MAFPQAAKLASHSGFRLIPRLETYPRLVLLVETPPGKLLLLAVFGLTLRLMTSMWLNLILILAAITFFPRYRRILITAGTLYWLRFHEIWLKWEFLANVARQSGVEGAVTATFKVAGLILFFAFCAGCWYLVTRFKTAVFARRPIVSLHVLFTAVLLAACYAPMPGIIRLSLWCFIVFLGLYFWYLCYSFADRNAKDRDGFLRQAGTYHPFWLTAVATPTPYPKGSAYLRKTEAATPHDLAITQLKGLKLLLWALVLQVSLDAFVYAIHGQQTGFVARAIHLVGPHLPPHLFIPTFAEAFQRSILGKPYAWYLCWSSVACDFVQVMLGVSVIGHQIIAGCRMAGFRVLRSTYRPLQSRSIADFWNRYSYYFKELLVDFFFYPTYLRYFKRHPRIRMLAATFAAAGFGNMFFHFIRDIDAVAVLGLWKAIAGFHVYAFYAVVLSVAIGISQLRAEQRKKSPPPHWFRVRVISPAVVILFYCVLHVFDDTGRAHPLGERFVFLMNMLGA